MKKNIYCGLKMSVSLSLMRNKRGECAGTEGIFRSTGRFSSTAAAYIYLELIREGNSLMSRQKTIPSVSISVDFFFIQSHVCWLCKPTTFGNTNTGIWKHKGFPLDVARGKKVRINVTKEK